MLQVNLKDILNILMFWNVIFLQTEILVSIVYSREFERQAQKMGKEQDQKAERTK